MDPYALLESAAAQFDGRLASLPDSDWSRPTQMTDCDIRDLVDHVVAGNQLAVLLLGGTARDEAEAAVSCDVLGEHPVEAWAASALEQRNAFRRPGALEVVCQHPQADITGAELLSYRTADLVLHAADLGAAMGTGEQPSAALLDHLRVSLPLMTRLVEPSALDRLTDLLGTRSGRSLRSHRSSR